MPWFCGLAGCCAGLYNAELLTDGSQHLISKVSPLVAVQLTWDSEAGEHLDQAAGCGLGALVGHRVRIGSLDKVVHSHKSCGCPAQ